MQANLFRRKKGENIMRNISNSCKLGKLKSKGAWNEKEKETETENQKSKVKKVANSNLKKKKKVLKQEKKNVGFKQIGNSYT